MRRDLTLGCAGCRLRFSSKLTYCPVCRNPGFVIPDAIGAVQPTSRAAWLGKWLITLSTIPAIGGVIAAGTTLGRDNWPPRNAIDLAMFILGGFGTCLGAGIAVAIPLALWVAIVRAVSFVLKWIVDRPRRSLRVSIEIRPRITEPKQLHPMHRLWEAFVDFIRRQADDPKWILAVLGLGFLSAQALAEIFGSNPVVKFSNWGAFSSTFFHVVLINVMGGVMISIFGVAAAAAIKFGYEFLNKPPNLFGYDPNPPELVNETNLSTFLRDRHEVIGQAVSIDEAERSALGLDSIPTLVSPLSGQSCFAFRLVGEADGQPIDDADAIAFAVIGTDQKRHIVSNADVVVYAAADTEHRSENAVNFLRTRRLPETNLNLREGLVREGTTVRVVGRRTDLRVGSAGYRDAERRVNLDAGDGLPVVIRAMDGTSA